MKKNMLLLGFLLFAVSLTAQKYTTAAGLRIGTAAGITVQQRIFKGITIEGIFQQGLFKKQSNVMLMLERHQKLLFQRRLNFYYGGGLQFGSETLMNIKSNTFGLAGILGAEMTVGRINLSLDWNPRMNLKGSENFLQMGTALSARYVIIKAPKAEIFNGKNKKKKKKKKKKMTGATKFNPFGKDN